MRSDFDPDAVRGAILREGLAFAVHGLLLPFGRRSAVPRRRERRADLRTVVFVHGLGANRAGFLPMQTWLRGCGHRRQIAFRYRSRGSIEAIALRLKALLDDEVQGGRIDLVTHSMGGLVARVYLQMLGGARRVDRLVTLGTPHHGSHAASFIPSNLVRQLLPGSSFLRHLNALPAPAGVRALSVVAGRDLLVQPVESSAAPFGAVRRFDELGHVELLFRPEVLGSVQAFLDGAEVRPAAPAPALAAYATSPGGRSPATS
jgi:pimeloyl-ACP methyl ester carboxylesterase